MKTIRPIREIRLNSLWKEKRNMRVSKFLALLVGIVVLAIVNLLLGSVKIPVADVCRILFGAEGNEIWANIIWKSRLPQALTAIMAGAGLAVSGLQMQTVFRNPLAGPSVLGISNGSALGVAFVVLLSGRIGGVALSRLGYLGDAAMSVAAIVGALAVMMLINNRCDDRLSRQCHHRRVEVPVARGGCEGLRSVGTGIILSRLRRRDGAVYRVNVHPAANGIPIGETHEPSSVGRPLCSEPRLEHPSQSYAGDCLQRCSRGHRHSLLRSHHVHWSGCSPSGPCHLPHF